MLIVYLIFFFLLLEKKMKLSHLQACQTNSFFFFFSVQLPKNFGGSNTSFTFTSGDRSSYKEI